jgi:Zn-finger nucleic acid-binding protein
MNCPGCDAELANAEAGDESLHICSACGGLSIGVSELNRLLLHNSLPGIESLGGRRGKTSGVSVCRTCQVDLTRFEGGNRHDPEHYELCEECGCVFLDGDSTSPGELAAAEKELVAFFRLFVRGHDEGAH